MKYLPIYASIVFFLLSACNAEQIEVAPSGNEIIFSSGVVMTRGAIDSGENDFPKQAMEDIQLIRGADGALPAGFASAGIASSALIKAGTGSMELATPQFFKDFVSNAHFFAFYPKHDTYTGGAASWTIDGTQDIMVTAPATAIYNRNGAVVNFRFEHRLAQVILKLVADDQVAADLYGDLLSATIEVPTALQLTIDDDGSAVLDTLDNSNRAHFNFGAMELKTDTVTSDGLLVFPDNVNPSYLSHITLEFENRSATRFPIENLILTAGYRTLIIATVKAHAVNFNVVALEEWNPVSETEGQDDEIGLGDPGDPL